MALLHIDGRPRVLEAMYKKRNAGLGPNHGRLASVLNRMEVLSIAAVMAFHSIVFLE